MRTKFTLAAAAAASVLVLAGCGSDGGDPFADEDGATATGGSGQTVVVGGANFSEMLIMQEMYVALLEEAGYSTSTINADQREVYFPELAGGSIGVVPEYAATMAEYLNVGENGADAPLVATSDAAETVEAMRPLAQAQGVDVLEPAEAASQNAFAVTQDFAEQNSLATLTDLGELGQPVVLAATEECGQRPFCEPGLEQTYDIDITEVLPTGFGTPQTKEAVSGGSAQLGLVGSTDATLEAGGLVVLEDDQALQLADNLVPVVNAELAAAEPGIAEALNQLAPVLTTDDLAMLNAQVDAERLQASDVARDYLVEQGLIEG